MLESGAPKMLASENMVSQILTLRSAGNLLGKCNFPIVVFAFCGGSLPETGKFPGQRSMPLAGRAKPNFQPLLGEIRFYLPPLSATPALWCCGGSPALPLSPHTPTPLSRAPLLMRLHFPAGRLAQMCPRGPGDWKTLSGIYTNRL